MRKIMDHSIFANSNMSGNNNNYRNKKKFNVARASVAELQAEVKRLEYTCKQRGKAIGGLYWALHKAVDSNPMTVEMDTRVNENVDKTVKSLQEQLSSARVQIKTLMESKQKEEIVEAPSDFACAICYNKFDHEERTPLAYGCGHISCSACTVEWTQKHNKIECPRCRQEIKTFLTLYV